MFYSGVYLRYWGTVSSHSLLRFPSCLLLSILELFIVSAVHRLPTGKSKQQWSTYSNTVMQCWPPLQKLDRYCFWDRLGCRFEMEAAFVVFSRFLDCSCFPYSLGALLRAVSTSKVFILNRRAPIGCRHFVFEEYFTSSCRPKLPQIS